MDHKTFTWGGSGNRIRRTQRWIDRLSLLGLLLAALLLFSINLGSGSLKGVEQSISHLASQLLSASGEFGQWLYPTLEGETLIEHPPLLAWLIAVAYQFGGVNVWTTRLPGAILSVLSVLLVYGLAREIFPCRQKAIFSSLIYLTFLPIAHYGRMAILDGANLCFVVLMMWCVLRSRRDSRWSLAAGIGLGLIFLTKGIVVALLITAITLLFLAWDTPRLLSSTYWWLGLLLGYSPAIAWYTVPLLVQDQRAVTTIKAILYQSLRPIWKAEDGQNPLPWYYLGEILKFSAPWLLFFYYWLQQAWQNRHWGWAKLVLVWAGGYLIAISFFVTKLPEYVLPVYPALALAGGAQLTEIWHWPSGKSYPRFWSIGLSLLGVATISVMLHFGITKAPDLSSWLFFACVPLTMVIAGMLVARRDRQFMVILFWGSYISLLILMSSDHGILKFLI
ncbi:MAG: glycosyltransferase family 39 protein [Moorea sp. SIO2I5]|nr:glycosyltransferase family 39 protein [Moorena sp. SIO2I5]